MSQADAFNDQASYIVPRPMLATIAGVTERQVTNYVKDGMPQAARGMFDLRECVPWLMDKARGRAKTTTEASSATELNVARRKRIELEMRERSRELVPVEDVRRTVIGIASLVASMLDGFAPRIAGEVATLDNPAEIQKLVFLECRSIRGALAEKARELEIEVPETLPAPAKKPARKRRSKKAEVTKV